ncbi:putative amidohydrolase YtcJ [Conyzicola lurida]|uniref:Putative amidohydrolase YtcJ n=1 Tax=Conyzicola lurida TaxID=1172621 RepID=A0A841AK44_9MICO|nr:amidohydrolase [Conyzicola lurida]MBB5843587.1 putative amidohydrolase YtcJ [Conyzicola lurida]
MLLRNARISGSDGELVDILPINGTIASISPASGSDRGVDLGGRWVSPGLWDNHVHFSQWALIQQRLDISTAASAADAAAMVARALESAPPEPTPFIGFGFRDGLWADEPTVVALDEAAGARPVVLVSGDLHAVWLNSAALTLYGHAGHPTGLLREDPAFEVTRQIGAVSDELLDSWADAAARVAASRGVVGIIDLEMRWNLETWTRRMASGADSLRVEFGIYSEDLDRAIAEGLKTGDRVTELLTVGRYKVLTDGSLNTRTAYCFDEYSGREGEEHSHGMLTMPPESLLPLMRKAVDAGIVPTVHAIGDHANSLALDAFAELGVGGRIEHAQLLAESDIARFAELGVEASVQPDHAVDDRDIADHHWAGSADRAFAFRSLLDAGATLALGSDAPVSPLDPWNTIAAAVTRTRGSREAWHPEQRITVAEALAASTRTTVEVGQIADLVVTETDPLAASPHELRGFPVAATLLGGRFTYNAL